MRILGIDPGTNILGFGVIRKEGNNYIAVDHGILRLNKMETYEKLSEIFTGVQALIEKHNIKEVSIEAPFFGDNAQSMLKLGRAQGVAIAAAATLNIPVTEYAPTKIKMAVTGKGYSTKEQVSQMVVRLLNLKNKPVTHDASDALAIALTHALQGNASVETKMPSKKKAKGNWDSFLRENPNRILK